MKKKDNSLKKIFKKEDFLKEGEIEKEYVTNEELEETVKPSFIPFGVIIAIIIVIIYIILGINIWYKYNLNKELIKILETILFNK